MLSFVFYVCLCNFFHQRLKHRFLFIVNPDDYNKTLKTKTQKALKDLCRKKRLPVCGKKQDCIDRLMSKAFPQSNEKTKLNDNVSTQLSGENQGTIDTTAKHCFEMIANDETKIFDERNNAHKEAVEKEGEVHVFKSQNEATEFMLKRNSEEDDDSKSPPMNHVVTPTKKTTMTTTKMTSKKNCRS